MSYITSSVSSAFLYLYFSLPMLYFPIVCTPSFRLYADSSFSLTCVFKSESIEAVFCMGGWICLQILNNYVSFILEQTYLVMMYVNDFTKMFYPLWPNLSGICCHYYTVLFYRYVVLLMLTCVPCWSTYLLSVENQDNIVIRGTDF